KPGSVGDGQNVGVEAVHLLLGGEVGHIHLVAHGVGQGIGDPLHHHHVVLVLLHDLLVAVHKALAVPAAGVGAVVVLAHRHIGAAKGDHIGPDLVDIGGPVKVDHIRGEAAAGPPVDLQGHDLALFAHAGLVLG